MGRVSLQSLYDKMDKKWVECDRYTEKRERWVLECSLWDVRQLWFIEWMPIEQKHRKRLICEHYTPIYEKLTLLIEDLEEV